MILMAKSTKPTLTKIFCRGNDTRFNGIVCPYYKPGGDDLCQLLEERRMTEFWRQCRGAWEIFWNVVKKCYRTFRKSYPDIPIDEEEDFKFDEVIERLGKQPLDTPNLAVWYTNVDVAIYRESKRSLVQQGLIPDKRNCGSCKYLSISKSYVCSKTGEIKKKLGPPCEEYSPRIPHFKSIDEDSPYKNRVMSRMNEANRDDEPDFIETVLVNIEEELQKEELQAKEKIKKTPEQILFRRIQKLLKERARTEKPGSTRRRIYERQYDVLIFLIHKFSEGFSPKQIITMISRQFGLNRKMIERDLKEVRIFLREKMSSNE
jgi:hypothetical protein